MVSLSVTDNERAFYIYVLGIDGTGMTIADLRAAYYANPPASGSTFDPSAPQTITGKYTFTQPPDIPDGLDTNDAASNGQLSALASQINGAWDAWASVDVVVPNNTTTLSSLGTDLLITIPADALKDRWLAFNWEMKYDSDMTQDIKFGLTVTGTGVKYFIGANGLVVGAVAPAGSVRADTIDDANDTGALSFQVAGQGVGVMQSHFAAGELFIPKTITCTLQATAAVVTTGSFVTTVRKYSAMHLAVWKSV
jgi:hypothetical protein